MKEQTNILNQNAFTLIELLIVIVIIGILTALTATVGDYMFKRTKHKIYNIQNIQNRKIEMFARPSESYDNPIERRLHAEIEEELLVDRFQRHKIKP